MAPGRPPVTTREELERVAMRLFSEQGFDATTVEDIAAAAAIGRRTFFRYFASKNDVVWGHFSEGLLEFRATLAATPADVDLSAALRRAIVAFNALSPEQVPVHRQRMTLILTVSSLQAHSTLMYAEWRAAVEDFVASRTGDPTLPRLAGHLMLGAAVTAYEQWLADGGDLAELLDVAVARAARALAD